MKNIRVSPRIALTTIAVFASTTGLWEWRALYALDHPKPPPEVSCVACHSDAKTLRAMADKAGDDLYIVRRGDMTRAEYDRIMAQHTASAAR